MTVAEQRAGYPRDLNCLVNQYFFVCLSCKGQFHATPSGAHHSRHCPKCRIVWRERQTAAVREVRRAVMDGRLPPVRTLRCVDCGMPGHDYEHRDYDKPLDVVPVCRSCNQKRKNAK
jgi:hypothetical protein